MRSNPHLYEINARIWLGQLRGKYGPGITLPTVPDEEWLELRHLGFDVIWLMGVWQPSPKALEIARSTEGLVRELGGVCPGGGIDDIGASPYSIYDYRLNPDLGGEAGLGALREKLNGWGMKLFLDFVTNHLAIDHRLMRECPYCFVQGDAEDARDHPDWFFESESGGEKFFFAYGRDPHFPPWKDTVQLNYFNPATREEMIRALLKIAEVCDGVRCDMVMLTLNDIHEGTWGWFLNKKGFKKPETEFWRRAIETVREKHPRFTFLAEVYWGLEWRLQEMGFDYTYDKVIYDRLRYLGPADIRGHLRAEKLYQKRSVRFIENHDETPAMAAFGREKSLAAAVAMSTLRGMRFYHNGQLDGVAVKVPVQFLRCAARGDPGIRKFYEKLLKISDHPAFHGGEWTLIEARPCSDEDNTSGNLLCWCWNQRRTLKLVVVNYSDGLSRGRLPVAVNRDGEAVTVFDELSERFFSFSADEIKQSGIFVELPPYGAHIFDIEL